jgi:hypothetical protein
MAAAESLREQTIAHRPQVGDERRKVRRLAKKKKQEQKAKTNRAVGVYFRERADAKAG